MAITACLAYNAGVTRILKVVIVNMENHPFIPRNNLILIKLYYLLPYKF